MQWFGVSKISSFFRKSLEWWIWITFFFILPTISILDFTYGYVNISNFHIIFKMFIKNLLWFWILYGNVVSLFVVFIIIISITIFYYYYNHHYDYFRRYLILQAATLSHTSTHFLVINITTLIHFFEHFHFKFIWTIMHILH